jgi:hypothetical protein
VQAGAGIAGYLHPPRGRHPIAITGVGGYFGGAGEVIVWNLRTGRMRKRPVGALCCASPAAS